MLIDLHLDVLLQYKTIAVVYTCLSRFSKRWVCCRRLHGAFFNPSVQLVQRVKVYDVYYHGYDREEDVGSKQLSLIYR